MSNDDTYAYARDQHAASRQDNNDIPHPGGRGSSLIRTRCACLQAPSQESEHVRMPATKDESRASANPHSVITQDTAPTHRNDIHCLRRRRGGLPERTPPVLLLRCVEVAIGPLQRGENNTGGSAHPITRFMAVLIARELTDCSLSAPMSAWIQRRASTHLVERLKVIGTGPPPCGAPRVVVHIVDATMRILPFLPPASAHMRTLVRN